VPAAHPEVEPIARQRAQAVISAGLTGASVAPEAWGLDAQGCPWLDVQGTRITVPLRGAHQAANAMLAVATAQACGVPLEAAAAGLAAMTVPGLRGTWDAIGEAVLLNDAYNANPPSMRAALDLLSEVGGGRQRVAILGTMRELGVHAEAQHRAVARAALASAADLIAGVGEFAAAFAEVAPDDPRVVAAADLDALWALLEPRLRRDAVILLKASRGMRLERLVPRLTTWASA
jgi:UDP-N-acetylmuramoyl-tripeptide--D-alanyl-D-alanine ligase